MKFFTPPLVGQRKKSFRTFFFGQSAEQKHYRATHYNENITLLWLEASQFGKLHCFPCVLQEGDELLAFQTFKSMEASKINAMLIQRWNLFVNPENIKTDYHVEEMTRRDFYELFNDLRRRALEAEREAMDKPETALLDDAPAALAESEATAGFDDQTAEQADGASCDDACDCEPCDCDCDAPAAESETKE